MGNTKKVKTMNVYLSFSFKNNSSFIFCFTTTVLLLLLKNSYAEEVCNKPEASCPASANACCKQSICAGQTSSSIRCCTEEEAEDDDLGECSNCPTCSKPNFTNEQLSFSTRCLAICTALLFLYLINFVKI